MGKKKRFRIRRPKGKKKTPAAADSPTSFPPWIELPRDVTANILQRLGAVQILKNAQKVCTTWRRVTQEPSFWRVIDIKSLHEQIDDMFYADSICRQAVDRSQGELIDINIEFFGTDNLLDYISERSSHLRRLRLACCANISSKGLSEAVKKLPELEDLHLFFMPQILAADIEKIGISCPMLKSFTFNDRAYRFPLVDINDDYALAVGKTMPNLCHLRLFGNRMQNKGLETILDGCPHLESLDLRQCFCVDLTGDLAKRCSEQIKVLRHPSDSCSDYEWDAEIYDDEDDEDTFGLYGCTEYDDIYGYEDYDDYTDPFNNIYFSDNEMGFFGDDEYAFAF